VSLSKRQALVCEVVNKDVKMYVSKIRESTLSQSKLTVRGPLILGIFLALVTSWLLLWVWSSASLRCVECDCHYELTAANPRCRLPIILMFAFLVALVGMIASFGMAWLRAKRK